MSASDGFQAFLKDQLAGFGPVVIRRMFGGAGVYADSVMFALIADDTLYLKADATTAPDFEAEGMGPFTYTAKDRKPITMSYWEAPPRLLEAPDELAEWARAALAIACAQENHAQKDCPQEDRRQEIRPNPENPADAHDLIPR